MRDLSFQFRGKTGRGKEHYEHLIGWFKAESNQTQDVLNFVAPREHNHWLRRPSARI
jgi:hypothetical protein